MTIACHFHWVSMAHLETRSPHRSTLEKVQFASKGGAVIALGSFKNHDSNPGSVYKHTFIVHDVNDNTQQHIEHFKVENSGGLKTTRFGKGFERRNETSIINPVRDVRRGHSQHVERRAEATAAVRSVNLKVQDSFHGHDIITGHPKQSPGNFRENKPEGLKYLGDGLGFEAPNRANILLRDSAQRFFTPHPSGTAHEYRQEVIVKNGCFSPRHSSIIQLGKQDIPSAGVEDQFSKSNYVPLHPRTQTGLHEMREPGRYTPR